VLFRLAADAVLVVHLAFVVFVVAGALFVLRMHWLAWIHIPAAVWGAFVELTGRVCPLTFLENGLRRAAGQLGYENSFVEHYIVPVIYPAGLTRELQFWAAGIVFIVNAMIYSWLLFSRRASGDNAHRPPRK
jgi:hypothetical protein